MSNISIQKQRAINQVKNIIRQYDCILVDDDYKISKNEAEDMAKRIIDSLRRNKIIDQWKY